MRIQRYIRTIIAMLMLLLYGAVEVWAQDPRVKGDDIIIQVMPSGKEEKESVTTSEGTVSAIVAALTGENYQVTLTVTPASGYKIKKDLIVVEKMVNPDRSSRRRTPGIGTFVLDGSTDWVTSATDYTFTIPAEYDGAYVTATFVSTAATPKVIVSLDEIDDFTAAGNYKLGRDIVVSGSSLGEFSGTLDGDSHIIYNLSNPLFSSINGGTVKNLFFDNVSISGGTNAGAVCGEATGDSRIYNCGVLATGSIVETDAKGYTSITSSSSTISGSESVGGLVGVLDGTSRVINCFSYADISGGTYVGGIVGYNNVATNSDLENLKTMVMNCMFYGNITGNANKAPIYNGKNIVNKDAKGVGNYNYFRSEASWAKDNNINTPNCALMAEDRFLQRFEFFRHLLNSHLELAGWWATGTYSKSEMMKWVLEPSQIGTSTPYPILKTPGKYASVVNIDVNHSTDIPTVGTTMGTLGVSISKGTGGAVYDAPTGASITNGSLTLNITDKDPEHFNFNYGKVQLPYYNDVGSGNYTGNRVVTGWKIVSITVNGSPTTEGTGGWSTGADVTVNSTTGEIETPYNFADRNSTKKDLYSVSGRVFNQGAYWDVPEGVTAITIEPYWAKCTYLADPNADKVYNEAMNAEYDVPNVGGGQKYTNGNSYPIAGESQVVFTTMGNAIASSNSGLFQGVTATNHTVYDYAVVLVGNYHFFGTLDANTSKPYTVTSIDLDGDNEPDYSYILRFNGRTPVHPVRVDFINIPGLGMAQKSTGGTGTYNFGILQPKGFFESTNTSLFYVTQFEYDAGRAASPTIVQGGVFEQWVGGQGAHQNKITYFHVGGNVWFKEFHRGTHQDKTWQSKHPPVSVTGGDYDEFYLTGLYTANVANYEDNAECYINGGRFGTVCGAAMEGIGKANGASNTGNITWLIQNADIKEFYAGGLNAAKPVTGNLSTIITGSHVDIFCGGPKFGDMSANKTVTTNATNCTFGTFFGAGYGGNSYSREAPRNHNNIINFPHNDKEGAGNDDTWNAWLARFYKQEYNATYGGVSTQFNYQFLPMSSNVDNVARIFVEYVKFSLATTRNVTSTLTGCTITGNFYGGGSLGKVDGNVTSTLTGCTVNGDAFGAGFSGSLPTVEVDDRTGFETEPWYYTDFGTYRTGVKKPTTTYTWQHGDAISVDNGNHILYTTEDLTSLGTVTGLATLNIEGTTKVIGNVYGGGESSDVADKTGAKGAVELNIHSGTISHDVYGGGKGKTTVVNGDVEVNIGAKDGGGTLSGSGKVLGNVYGGSAFGAVNASKDDGYDAETNPTAISAVDGKKTQVNLYGGDVTGNVFGGGLGQTSPSDIAAQNYGNTTVSMEGGTVSTAVYGGANVNGVLKKDTKVQITGGTVGTYPTGEVGVNSITNVVFGGGLGQPTLVNGNVTVNIGREKTGEEADHFGNATINGHVYGGSALGCVNASKSGSDPMVFYNVDDNWETKVNLYKGTIKGNVYGGGLGKKEVVAKDAEGVPGDPGYIPAVAHEDGIEAFVGGDVQVLLDGAKLQISHLSSKVDENNDDRTFLSGQIFGANNLNGTPKGDVLVHVKRTVDSSKSDATAFADRTTYDVAAVYGGGNQADYVPTKALSDDEDIKKQASAQVIIEGCDLTSIEYVYGGGNAAAVPATDVTIKGTYIIDYLFGGGNGKSTTHAPGNPGADVGIYKVNNTPTYYGTGVAKTTLYAGKIRTVFGGSNTKGNVHGGSKMTMPEVPSGADKGTKKEYCSALEIKNIYGAGNQAEQDGDVDLVLGCVTGMENVYGGANAADVKGGVNLTITSGSFTNVFGGNDRSGTIQGPITLNIEETACDPITITNLYLGGNQAAYSVYGYYRDADDGNKLKPRTSLTDHTSTAIDAPASPYSVDQWYRNPILNVISCTSIGNVFGGGYGATADMYGSPTVNLNMIPGDHAEEIDRDGNGADNNAHALGTIGNVYGGGNLATVHGDATVNIGTANSVTLKSIDDDPATNDVTENEFSVEGIRIVGNVYGGGNAANIIGASTVNIGTKTYDTADYEGVSITGDVFGGGKGKGTQVTGSVAVKIGEKIAGEGDDPDTYTGNATITGDIYGGSALGSVNAYDNSGTLTHTTSPADATTAVTLNIGTITGSIYGGGLGERDGVSGGNEDVESDVYGPVTVTVNNGSVSGAVYGCNNLNGSPKSTVAVNIVGTTVPTAPATYTVSTVYGGGNLAPYTGTGGLTVSMSGGYVNDVFGGGLGTSAVVTGNTAVNVSGGSVTHDIYGGGSEAQVTGGTSVTLSGTGAVSNDIYGGGKEADVQQAVTVQLDGGTVGRDVYGGGALAQTNTSYASGDTPATIVNLNGATVTGNVYGGGLGQLAVAGSAGTPAVYYSDVAEYNADKGTSLTSEEFALLTEEQKTKTPAVAAVAAVSAVEADVDGPVTVTVSSGTAANVFGCNNVNGMPKSTVAVVIGAKSDGGVLSGSGTVSGSVYGGGNQAACTGSPTVTLYGGTVSTNVYGGGLGSTAKTGSATVVMEGGTVGNDVFGGGSQADVTGNVSVSVSGGTITNDVYGGGALANTNTGNWDATTNTWKINRDATETYYIPVKHLTVGTSVVTGYFTGSDGSGEITAADTKAEANTTYYKRIVYVEDIHDIAENGTTYKTTVNLTGGVIGNAYGGGLGKLGTDGTPEGTGYVKAMVYGDVAVNVNGAAFTELVEASAKNAPVTGRVFGCNNINGTPKGNVTVTIYETRRIDGGEHTLGEFEIQGVYGGGNLADYVPETYDGVTEFGQNTRVIINDCAASISKVYGGGNAARVPFTDVTINGAFEIGYVFGGGNGGDMIYKNGSWIDNPGAYVTRYTNVLLKGGTIGQAFGGSDSRGSVGGSDIRQESGGLCPLHLVNLYGAGNGELASSTGDINVDVSGCGEHSEIQNVYGGSYKANITGNVTLNIKSGIFTSVFGGNDRRGSIGGNIYVNIEETDDCDKPIIIQNLYGGCYQTAYPGESDPDNHTPAKDKEGNDFTTGKITVNVKSATRIDRIFGGSDRGEVTGDTEVNINMIRGSMSGHTDVPLPSHYTTTSKPSNIVVTNTEGYVMVYGLIAGESSVEGYYYTDVYTQALGTAVADTKYYRLVPVTFTEIPSAEITVGTTDVSSYYTRDVDIYTQASGVAAAATIYYKAITYSYTQVPDAEITVGSTDVSSFYTHSEVSHTLATGQAQPGITYYKPSVKGNILEGIGTIGNVYGGGNIGKVTGNTVVNIGTLQTVTMETVDDDPSTGDVDEKHPKVLGAHIYGDVFGGCNAAPVTKDTEVNIGTADYSGTANFEGIFIDKDTNGNGGSVYGGGSQGDVLGNTNVTMSGGYVYDGVYGGGLLGSVGTITSRNAEGHTSHEGCVGGKPDAFTPGTGKCTVVISGGQIGPVEVATEGMKKAGGPVDVGFVFGAGRGEVLNPDVDPDADFHTYVKETEVIIKNRYEAGYENGAADSLSHIVGNPPIIMASVYGGGENGRVRGNTFVKIYGGQIGCGEGKTQDVGGKTVPKPYTETQWTTADPDEFTECASWDYGVDVNSDGKKEYLPYDPLANIPYRNGNAVTDGATTGTDGHTYYGYVFGGGSGYFPYEIKTGDVVTGHDWLQSAGQVEGHTKVHITGGHILTNVYGGNELTDVRGSCTVIMTGGTLGVPRKDSDAKVHPVTCYLFGAGKGDQRSHFNTWTNVQNTQVIVSGTARIFGSVFGGSEDGHVLGDAKVNIGNVKIDLNGDGDTTDSGETFTASNSLKIGTYGTSYVDGNVFGGGRGFSGKNLNAGVIGGNTEVNISGGTMLGSVYGGGRLASVGVDFSSAQNASTGQFTEDDGGKTYGHVTINITGGTIGNTSEDAVVAANGHTTGGNVFGGSMGRLTLLDDSPNDLWSKLAQVKTSSVNITGTAVIKSNVYGGAEFGTTRDRAFVTVGGTRDESSGDITPDNTNTPTVNGCVYGSGYGSTIDDPDYNSAIVAGETTTYLFTPMQYAGIVGGETEVNIVGKGHVLKNVYGGGEMASVGVIDYSLTEDATNGTITYNGKKYKYAKAIKHDSHDGVGKTFYDFGLSWPYEFDYVATLKDGVNYIKGGKTTVNITGSAQVDHYVYGGGRGKVWFGATQATPEDITEQRYREAHIANVRETHVTIGTSEGSASLLTPTIGPGSATASASVYGGGEDGHVIGDANVTIYHGYIGHSVFGGGKGLGQYTTTLWDPNNATEGQNKASSELAYSWTAGRVYGNTTVTMKGGKVGWFVYGGGNLASVGKGSYTGGSDDYSTGGYGELPSSTGAIWTVTPETGTYAHHFQNSGIATVNLLGGTVGTTNGGKVALDSETYASYQADGVPYGSVFGGSRGKAALSCKRSPRYRYVPDFFLGYTNKGIVNIGGTSPSVLDATGPIIYGSVYGGGQDGHVRNSTEVHVYKGNIAGQDPTKDTSGRTGHVFGAGSGIGTYHDASDNKDKCNNSSGSVTCTTLVEVYGDNSDNPATATTKIHGNVYGGGALSSVGPPNTGSGPDEQKAASVGHASYSYTRVDIKGGRIDGSVYAASRGPSDGYLATNPVFDTTDGKYDPSKYATDIWSYLYVTGGTVLENVYGGGEAGHVKQDTEVHLTGGTITHKAYGGGKGTVNVPANVMGNATVELNNNNNGADADGNKKGCVVSKVFGCNDFRGSPKGHVKVHVFATQNSGTDDISTKVGPGTLASLQQGNSEGYIDYLNRLIALSKDGVVVKPGITASVIEAAETAIDGKVEGTLSDEDKTAITNAAESVIAELEKTHDYDVQAVYGGGDLAMYEPENPDESTEVIIEGCNVTSIKQVYGGGNAAPVSGSNVTVKSCYIIDEVFGGGNGKDNYSLEEGSPAVDVWYENPGANVGYKQLSHYVKSEDTGYDATIHGSGTYADPYKAITNTSSSPEPYNKDATTPEGRRDNYTYGNGEAITTINGGHIHAVYGCSNVKGNIRKEARSVYQRSGTCDMVMDNTYGGSKESDTDGLITVEMDCVENGGTYYGGSYKANIYSDINIHITNGTYDKIFGGNDRAGTINGKITITVEEYGCTPIRINELYAGGNLAPYSVYGYKTETQDALDANGNTYQENGVNVQQRIPYRAGEVGARTTPYWDPRINIISATEIGTIYGGGYGATATVIGNPHVNVNMTEGKIRSTYNDYKPEYATLYPTYDGTGEDKNRVIPIGTIGKIYGGGNLASVEGDTYVEIGTGQWISSWDANGNPVWQSATASGVLYSYKEKTPAVYYTQAECDEYNADPANNVTGYIASGTVLSAEQVTIIKEALGTSYVAGAELTTKDANAYNATLSGARKTTDVKTPAVYYTQEECEEYNATLDGAQDNTDPSTAAAANTYNATLPGARKTTDVKTPAVYYTQAECDEYNKNISGYIAKHTKLSAEQATAVNTALTPNVSAGSPISVEYANAYNATLPNALKTTDVKTEAVWAWYDADNHEMANAPTLAPRNTAKITGDVYGGGKGEAKDSGTGAFQCEKGMIGVDGDGIDYPEGGTSVTIGNGTVTIGGSVYGGGEVGRVEKNTSVTIGLGDGTGTTGYPVVSGDVYGAGKGVPTHGYSALVRGNSTVTIQGDTKVGGNVYGGGEIASIGRYNVVGGRPTSLKNPNSGYCFVTVRGYAEIGPDNMTMTKVGGPDNKGHVFGAGKGAMPYIDKDGNAWAEPWSINKDNGKDIYNAASYTASYSGYDSPAAKAEAEHLKFIETLGLATHTDVTIGGHAFVKGDVFGGAEQGFVQHDTHVTIEGDCQIGNGYVQMDAAGSYLAAGVRKSVNRRYTDDEWTEGHLIDDLKDGTTAAATGYTSSLPECASWTYESPYAPHDIYADEGGYDSNGGAVTATNGHTFYGCVFGGGSGYFPYAAGKWHEKAGEVAGNTLVDIKGGHILTNVYGGSEMTNVDGKCTVNMSGGTIGVPRTLGQIVAHPVTCYLFGAGMGDSRKSFSLLTNVQNAEVNVRGGWIYGSVFGGAEDGHVLGNTTVNISDGKIGTYGTSYVDGNVFGGGRGFTGDVQTAGDVGGNVDVFIEGGTMLGSVFGGGRLASVGTWIVEPEEDHYGLFKDDDGSNTYGHVTVNISGGTIGNDLEDKVYDSAIDPTGKTDAELETALAAELTTLKNNDNIPLTEFKYDRENRKFRVSHSKGGNVYGGSMGRLRKLDGIINPIWPELAQVKTTSVNITGGTIKHNVYGGGEFGTVYQDAHVTIGGKWNAATDAVTPEGTGTVYRDVYGGGFGSDDYKTSTTIHVKEPDPDNSGQYKDATYTFTPMQFAGCVGKTTNVNILGGWVKKNVYGGGEMASVGVVDFQYALGHIHEAKKGSGTEETFTDFGLSWPYELTYQPGFEGTANVTVKGGRIGLTGKDYMGSNTSLTDEQKKALEEDNGDVFGGGRGITGDRYDMAFCANVNNTVVNINYTNSTATPANYKDNEAGVYAHDCVSGSVYGGGENGHVVGNTNVTLANGLIGHAMYGGGKGKDTYRGRLNYIIKPNGASPDDYETDVYGFTSGKVYGNTSITMTGGYVVRNIYGGGNMASVGKGNYAGGTDDYFTLGYGELENTLWTPSNDFDPDKPINYEEGSSKNVPVSMADYFLSSGKTDVKVLGGTVGYINPSDASKTVKDGLPYGNVFGGARGVAVPNINVLPPYLYTPTSYSGYVNEAKVTIGTAGQSNENAGESGKAPRIYGSVYGGGQDGHVRRDATVTVESGEIGVPFTDAYRTMFGKTGSTTLNEELDNPLWLHRGNVYGSGSGISKYQFDFDNNGDYNGTITYQGKDVKEEDWCSSSGSVTRFTEVDINGGIIHRNVYGGGSRASVGPPPNPMTPGVDPFKKGDTATGHTAGKQSQNTVIIKGTVGTPTNYNEVYGGEVYGGSRGDSESGDTYSTSVWTKVHIKNGAVIKGNVFGGGDAGKVKKDTDVIIGD